MKNVKDIIIDFDDYYINQGASSFANIPFKNGTTVGKYGCGVCCAAMIICREKGLTSNADKANVIKKVIADSTNNNGDLNYNTITYDGTSFKWGTTTDMAAEVDKGIPVICQLPGHYVLVNGLDTNETGFSAYLIKDPGARGNTNLAEPMDTYGDTIKSKRTLKAE